MFNLKPVPVPDLAGRTVLVTGAGRGIGAALVEQLSRAGARVFAGVHHAPVKTDAARIAAATRLPLDVTDDKSVEAAVAQVRREAGRLDALVNNAGTITPIGLLPSLTASDLVPAFNINVIGLHRVTRAAVPLLAAARGVVINAGTGAATTPMGGWTAYCASKAAARMLTKMMAMELADDGIRAFFIGIPPTDTDMQAEIRASGLNPISKIPQQDLVPVEVPASVIAWLCSARARTLSADIVDVRDDLFRVMSEVV